MSPRSAAPGSADPVDPDDERAATSGPGLPDLSALPIVGISRRRLAFLGGALATAWIVLSFARQVGEASAATARVDDIRAGNAALASEVAALEREAALIQGRAWIVFQARAFGVGGPHDVPFTLSARPELPANAPGSAAVRLGAESEPGTPLESWLSLLFGPSR